MEKTNDVITGLGKILSDRKFIASLMQGIEEYDTNEFEKKLGTVISYYIASRDSNSSYTYEEIESRYSKIKDLELEHDTELYKNTVTHGFFTHSFNGYKKDRIMQYGLNYMGNIKDEGTMAEVQDSRAMLQELESILGESPYIRTAGSDDKKYQHTSDEVFITTPGTKTVNYACRYAPERLYLGPLKQEAGQEEPIVVGETKQAYMLRVLTKKIQQKYPDTDSPEYMEAIKLAKEVTEYYCTKPPAVAFLETEKMKDMISSSVVYKPDEQITLEEWIKAQVEPQKSKRIVGYKLKGAEPEPNITGYKHKASGKIIPPEDEWLYDDEELEPIIEGYKDQRIPEGERGFYDDEELEPIYYEEEWLQVRTIGKFFSNETGETVEHNNLGDVVTLSKNIPDGAIAGVIDMLDEFEIKQIFAKAKGMKVGDLIDYQYCKYKGEPSIEQLLSAITPNCTEEDLEEIRRKYEKIKQPTNGKDQKISGLEAKKQEILAGQYPKKDGISTEYTLSDVFTEFEQNGLMPTLLEQDTTIEQDELQYQSNTHGVPHTRRVNFFAMAIMSMENITGRDREIILEIVKNHDIGRVHDWEDSEHGESSVSKIDDNEGRLEGFSEDEQALIKFVIEQHSRGAKENEQAISELPEELKQRYAKILEVFKDADKLDRVRLDPYGQNPREGLDVTRLSLESSRKLEGVAYESYSKLFKILDLEKQIQVTRDEPESEQPENQGAEFEVEFERRMQSAKEAIILKQQRSQTGKEELSPTDQRKELLQSIVGESKKKIGLKGINKFITTVKSEIMKHLNPNRDEQQNTR